MTGAAIALLIYLTPGVLIVGSHFRSTMAKHGHNSLRVVLPALLLAILTWPMIYVIRRPGE